MKKAFVQKKDYESYSIAFPLKCALGRRRRKFLVKELEKRHPRFSTANCFDTKMTLSRGRLTADVVVMEKARLLEYKNLFPDKTLALESRERRSVFKSDEKLLKPLVFSVLGLAVTVAAVFCVGRNQKIDDFDAVPSFLSSAKEEYMALSPQEFFLIVFDSVKKCGGKINSMDWNGTHCRFNIVGCMSEDVVSAQFCQVSYKNGEPSFVLQNDSFRIGKTDFARAESTTLDEIPLLSDFEESADHDGNFRSFLRNRLLNLGITLVSEQVLPDSATICFLADENNFSDALRHCAFAAEKFGWNEKSLSIERNDSYVTVKLSFAADGIARDEFYTSPFNVAACYSQIFCPKTDSDAVLGNFAVLRKKATGETLKKSSLAKRNRLGSIVSKDGRIFAYYKANDGKISMEEEIAE